MHAARSRPEVTIVYIHLENQRRAQYGRKNRELLKMRILTTEHENIYRVDFKMSGQGSAADCGDRQGLTNSSDQEGFDDGALERVQAYLSDFVGESVAMTFLLRGQTVVFSML